MATRRRIEMDFKQAMAQADEVDEIADRLSDISNGQLGDTMQNLAAAWRGENATSYLGKSARLQDKIADCGGQELLTACGQGYLTWTGNTALKRYQNIYSKFRRKRNGRDFSYISNSQEQG